MESGIHQTRRGSRIRPNRNPELDVVRPRGFLYVNMAPKKDNKKDNKPAKVAVDKTFGMKNKKGGAAQKHIAQIQSQASQAQTPEQKRKAAEKAQKEKEKAASEAAKRENAELFKPVQVQKVPFGVDPKTVLCQFYKQGACEKGKKCKFSHDLSIERKGEKRSLYTDTRDEEKEAEEEKKKEEDMADWDECTSVPVSKPNLLCAFTGRCADFM